MSGKPEQPDDSSQNDCVFDETAGFGTAASHPWITTTSTPWKVRTTHDGTLHLELSGCAIFSALRRPLVKLLLFWLVVQVSWLLIVPAGLDGTGSSHTFAQIYSMVSTWICAYVALDVAILLSRGPRALHVGPQRWHATLAWGRRAEGDTHDLVVEASKCQMKMRTYGIGFLSGWSHKVRLSVRGTPGRVTLWQVLCVREDNAEAVALAELVRAHVQRCRLPAGGAGEPLLSPERPASPALPASTRWTVHRRGGTLRLQLPLAPWSHVGNVYSVAFIAIVAPLLTGSVALLVLSIVLFHNAIAAVGSAVLVAIFLGLGALIVWRLLFDAAPRVLHLERESYYMLVGWPRFMLRWQEGDTCYLRAEEGRFLVASGIWGYDRDDPDDEATRFSLHLVELGRPGQHFWIRNVGSFRKGVWDFDQRKEVSQLVDIISQYLQERAEHALLEGGMAAAGGVAAASRAHSGVHRLEYVV